MKSVIDKSYDAFLTFLQKTSKEELNRMVDEVNENKVAEPTINQYFTLIGEELNIQSIIENSKDISNDSVQTYVETLDTISETISYSSSFINTTNVESTTIDSLISYENEYVLSKDCSKKMDKNTIAA